MNSSDDKFISKLRSDLAASLNDIDEKTTQQLSTSRAQAIHTAIEKKEAKTLRFPGWFSPTSAAVSFASISAITLALWLMPQTPSSPTAPFNIIEDISLLSAPEELEFYEDLDFYIWLDHEESPT